MRYDLDMRSRPISLTRALGLLAVLEGGLGCVGEELPLQYETEHLEIGTELDYPMCRGDLRSLERLVYRVEDELGFELAAPTTIYLWNDAKVLSGVTPNCPPGTTGCFRPSSQLISTTQPSLRHELVHAILGEADPGPFFEEGIADVYGGDQTRFGLTAPSQNMGSSIDSVDLGTGRHFVRWLRERWGSHKLGQLARSSSKHIDESFEDIYGVPIEQAEEYYFEDAPHAYPSLDQCDAPEMSANMPGPALFAQFDLNCEDGVGTHAAAAGLYTNRTFTIEERGYYTVQVDAEWFEVYRCSPPRIDEVSGSEGWLEDIPAHHTGYPSGASRVYSERSHYTLLFEAGLHHISVGREGHEDATVRLAIWPSSGSQPALGE